MKYQMMKSKIKLFRNTHIRHDHVPWTHWKAKRLTAEQERIWKEHGFLSHMLDPVLGISVEELYRACWNYENAFNPKYDPKDAEYTPEPEIAHLDAATFFRGIAALIEVDLIRAEITPIDGPDRKAAIDATKRGKNDG